MIKDVEELGVIAKSKPFRKLEFFEDAEIESNLEWPAKGIATCRPIDCLGEIARGGSSSFIGCRAARWHPASSRRDDVHTKGGGVNHRIVCVHARCTLKLYAMRISLDDRQQRVSNEIVPALTPKYTADVARKIGNAIGRAALCYCYPADTPAIDELIGHASKTRDLGDLILIADSEHVSTVEARSAICGSRIKRIISIEE